MCCVSKQPGATVLRSAMRHQSLLVVSSLLLAISFGSHAPSARAEQGQGAAASADGGVEGDAAPVSGDAAPEDQAPSLAPGPRVWTVDGDPVEYAEFFTDAALRVDLFHTGGVGGEEELSLDAVVREPIWPGRHRDLVDPTGYGQYRFRVYDQETNRLIFSQGYASLFGEWLTTAEADERRRTMHESVRFPFPRRPVRVVVDRRNRRWQMEQIYEVDVDPNHHSVRWERRYDFAVRDIEVNAVPREALDVLILGDGYTAAEMGKFRADAERFAQAFFEYEPYARNRERISIRAVEVESRESGTDEPRKGIWRDTPLGCSFNTFDSARYLTTENNLAMREIASLAPYDAIYIMVNTSRYGGGGIYNFYSVFAADNEYSEYVFIHEFGHSFGALGDEYHNPGATSYDEDAFYPRGIEPWEPNITALLPGRELSWADMIEEGTPIPTPPTEEYRDRIGAFEGAGYQALGLYRPCYDSIMFHKAHLTYCPVSERAIEWLIRWTANGGW